MTDREEKITIRVHEEAATGTRVVSAYLTDHAMQYFGPAMLKEVVRQVADKLAEEAYAQVKEQAVAAITSRLLKVIEVI